MADITDSDALAWGDGYSQLAVLEAAPATGALTDASDGIFTNFPTDSDSGALAEATSLDTGGQIDASDAFTARDGYTQVAVLGAVPEATLAESGSYEYGTTSTDSATLGEASVATVPTGVDSYTLGEDTSALLIDEVGPDGVLSETASLTYAVVASDTMGLANAPLTFLPGELTDLYTSLQYIWASLTGPVAYSDAVTLGETSRIDSTFGGIVVDQVASDTAALTDTGTAAVPYTGTDAATLAEAFALAVGASTSGSDSDGAVLAEASDAPAAGTGREASSLAEVSALVVEVVALEDPSMEEAVAALIAVGTAADTAALVERAIADYGFEGALEGEALFVPRLEGVPTLLPRLEGVFTMIPD